MASTTTKKRPSTKKKTSTTRGRKKTTKKQEDKPLSNDLKYELVVLLFIALSFLLIISIYFGLGGKVGESVRYFLFGAFGISAYILPIFILVASFIKIFNKGNSRLNNKLSLVFIGLIVVSTFSHILYIQDAQINKFISEKSAFFATTALYFETSALTHLGGGMVGGVVGDFFEILIGRIGSIIILVLISLSLVILVTEQSIGKVGRVILSMLTWLWNGFVALVKNMSSKSKERYASYKVEKEAEAVEKMGATEQEVRPMRASKIHKDRKGFLEKATLWLEEGKSEDKEEKEVRKKKKRQTTKSDEKKADSKYKIHGIDPFKQIAELEEKELATKGQQITADELMAEQIVVEEKPETVKPVAVEAIQTEIETQVKEVIYRLPPIELMQAPKGGNHTISRDDIDSKAEKLIQTLASFGVGAKVVDVSVGPTVTRYELQPDIGVKVSKIVNLQDDIALNLASSGIRIEAPIPGKSAVGIEVPNSETKSVSLREVIDTNDFKKFPSKLGFALGKDIGGKVMIADIARMPHLLIAGATGSGKSVCVNTLITSILYTSTPDEVKLLMIDPKVVELSAYNGIPHLLIPVVTDPKKAAGALNWAVQEMGDRYKLFAAANVRDLKGYNNAVEENNEGTKLPQIVIIVDELADLMMAAPNDVEDAICRLAQMARAAGLHLIIATQRPSVDVITGLIKANIPSRIAFNVSSGVDSRTIIDSVGAEKLLGKGDMLFYPVGLQKPVRVQGAFISDKEVENIVTFLKDQAKVNYNESIMNQLSKTSDAAGSSAGGSDYDSYFNEALDLVMEKQKASASMIQRYFRVGYNRAARIVDQLHDAGFVGDEEGSKPRKVLMTRDEYSLMKEEANKPAEEETQS